MCICVCACSVVCSEPASPVPSPDTTSGTQGTKKELSTIACLTLCIFVAFSFVFMSTCLMIINNQNISNTKIHRTNSETMDNPFKEKPPLMTIQEENISFFDAELALRSFVAFFLPMTWCLTLCIFVAFSFVFMSTCLMIINNHNISNTKIHRTNSETMDNPFKEKPPLMTIQEENISFFDAELALRSFVAFFLPMTWCLEYLARYCGRKKNKTGQNDTQVLKTSLTQVVMQIYLTKIIISYCQRL